jgi:DNA-binding NtrC family response regulator
MSLSPAEPFRRGWQREASAPADDPVATSSPMLPSQLPGISYAEPFTSTRERRSVMIVEDDTMVRDLLCEALGEYYEVFCVATAEAALSVLAGERIDVVLLDYHLRDGGRNALAKEVAQVGLPMVWMTADREVGETLSAARLLLLSKPFRIQQALEVLDEAFSGN